MDGGKAVEIARRAIELWVREGKKYEPEKCPEEFNEKRGVFVTIHSYPGKELRGCIGFPEPVYPLAKAITEAAISAAAYDPRFEPVKRDELDRIIIEVSVLTGPEPLKAGNPRDYAKNVRTGKDGLIVRKGFRSGLLLPQVATEQGWDAGEFLSQTCIKAGLPDDAWLEKGTKIYRFQSLIFSEKRPGEFRS